MTRLCPCGSRFKAGKHQQAMKLCRACRAIREKARIKQENAKRAYRKMCAGMMFDA